jgi:tripartite-type tricarboxylate transporter receptor subunit TctC
MQTFHQPFEPQIRGVAMKSSIRQVVRRAFLTAAVCVSAHGLAVAQDEPYPSKPIKIVVPYSAGGGTDQFLRLIAPDVAKRLGTQIVVDNRPGASTTIGVKAVASAKPDGYTLLLSTNGSFSITPYTMQPQPYKPEQALDYIGGVGETALILSVGASGPQTFKEFVALVKSKPGQLGYSALGAGSASHLAGELLQKDLGIDLVMVPFKGFEGSVAVAAGHVFASIDGEAAAGPLVSGGKLRPLAVLQHYRSRTLPDTPSLKDLGYPNADSSSLTLVMAAPKGTPPAIIQKVYAAFAETLRDPQVVAKLDTVRTAPVFMGPKEVTEFLRKQTNSFEAIFKKNGLEFVR